MNEDDVRKIIEEELSNLIRNDRYTFHKLIQILDGRNIQLGKTTGTKFGTAIDQKLAFFNATPVAQQASITGVNNQTVDSTYGVQERDVLVNCRTRINEIESALENLGFIASN